MKLSFAKLHLGKPFKHKDPTASVQEIFPQDCRLGGRTYSAPLICELTKEIDDVQ
jgi:hypothetical protein